jgi:hypothetical protein
MLKSPLAVKGPSRALLVPTDRNENEQTVESTAITEQSTIDNGGDIPFAKEVVPEKPMQPSLFSRTARFAALSDFGKVLYHLPHARSLQRRVESSGVSVPFNTETPERLEAALLQMKGVELLLSMSCFSCRNGQGPFPFCVTGALPDGRKLFDGACSNCIYTGKSRYCTLGCLSFYSF